MRRRVILMDRGVMDGKVFLSDAEFGELLEQQGLREEALMERYDTVFHLVSTAVDCAEHYA